jgi:uncharacterized repeat protein (TIGR02543 family)
MKKIINIIMILSILVTTLIPTNLNAASQTRNVISEPTAINTLFPDFEVSDKIREILDVSTVAILVTQEQLDSITELVLDSPLNASSIEGVQYLNNLQVFSSDYDHITDLSQLSDLQYLNEITFTHAMLTNLDSFANFETLEKLDVSSNQINDLSGLINLPNLTYLDISINPIGTIEEIAGLQMLEELQAYSTEISDLSPLANLTNLKTLGLKGNSISDISSLNGLTNLETLDLSFNDIQNIEVIANHVLLKSLNIMYNNITDLRPLGQLNNITSLEVAEQSFSNSVIDYSNPLVLQNQLYLPNGELVELTSISNYGTNEIEGVTWNNLPIDTNSVSYASRSTYQFNETVTIDLLSLYIQKINPIVYNAKIYNESTILSDGPVRVGDLIPDPGNQTSENEYCQFVGWYSMNLIDGQWELGPNWDFKTNTMPANDIMIMSDWTCTMPHASEIKFDLNGESGTPPATQYVVDGKLITEPTPPTSPTNEFVGWSTTSDNSSGIFDFNTPVSDDLTLYAIWTPKTYNVSFDTNGFITDPIASQTVEYGNQVVEPAIPVSDTQEFLGWSTTRNNSTGFYDFSTPVTEDLVLYAISAPISYGIIFDLNGEPGTPPNSQVALVGEKVDEPTPPVSNTKDFIGWSTTSDNSAEIYNFDDVVTTDLTLYAIWTPKTYDVSFDTNGFITDPIASQTVEYGNQVIEPTNPVSVTQEFLGWSTTRNNSTGFYDFSTPVTEDLVLYAISAPISYGIIFDLNGEPGTPPNSQVALVGEKVDEPTPPVSNTKDFIGWSTTSDNSAGIYNFDDVVTSDLTLYAIWTPKTYNVSFDTNGFITDPIASQTVEYGNQVVEPTNPVSVTQEFLGWSTTSDNSTGFYNFDDIVTSDLTLYAIWTPKTYNVSFDTNGFITDPIASQTVEYGNQVIEPINPVSVTQEFLGWSTTNDNSAGIYNFDDVVTSDLTLYAIWEPIVYTVNFDLNGHGINQPDDQVVDVGELVVRPSDPIALSHKFVGWSVTPDNSSGLYDFMTPVTDDVTLYAIWDVRTFNVSFDLNGHGSEVPAIQTIDFDGLVQVPSVPSELNYKFIGWSTTRDNSSGLFDFKTLITSDLVLYGVWESDNVPELVVPHFTEINVGDDFDQMFGVSATDVEDGDLTSRVIIDTDLNTDVAGIYHVFYQVTDSDGNVVESVQTVLVNDGTFVYDNDYIISGYDFTIGVSQVSDSDELFVEYGDVKVYDVNAMEYIDSPVLGVDRSNLVASAGVYDVIFSFNPSITLNVTVVEDTVVTEEIITTEDVVVTDVLLPVTGSSNRALIIGVLFMIISLLLMYLGKKI